MNDQFFCGRCGEALDLMEMLNYDLGEVEHDHLCTSCSDEVLMDDVLMDTEELDDYDLY